MRAATVAIVLFNFNGGRHLRESVDAICGQTRPADQVIVIDDGSTDDSAAVVEAVAARHGAITFLRHGRNLGLPASVARALTLVTAEYLVWTTPADRLLPTFLEKSMPPLERHPDAGLCVSGHLRDLPEHLTPSAIRRRMKRAHLPITGRAVVVRRAALLAAGGYPAALDWQADAFASIVVALRFGACVVPEPLALPRTDPDSAGIAALLDLLAEPRYRDIRRVFRQCPGNFAPFRPAALELEFPRARDWDLLLACALWDSREDRRGHRRTAAARLARLGIRLLRSVAGWRRRRLLALGRSVVGGLRSARSLHRTMRLMAVAVVKSRARPAADTVTAVATVPGPVTQAVVRNLIAWQVGLPGDRTAHGHLRVTGDRDDVQLDPLFSLLCLSGTFEDFTLRFPEPGDDREEVETAAFELGAPHRIPLAAVEAARLRRAFLPSFDGRRTVTSFLKIAHPRAVIVALSLSEDDEGLADEALGKWLPHLHRFRREVPGVAFCLLNRTGLGQDPHEPGPVDVSPVRSLGFGLADAVSLAQAADAFVGRLDAFGLAAIAAQRPGVYIAPFGGECAAAERAIWFVADASPEQCLDMLRTVLHDSRTSGSSSPSPPVAGGGPA